MERNELQTELQTTADQATSAYAAGNIVLGDVLLARCRALQTRLEAAPVVAQLEAVAPPSAVTVPAGLESGPQGTPDFETAFSAWLDRARELVTAGPKVLGQPRILEVVTGGRAYIRIAIRDSAADTASRSAFAFIERATGNVLKADGWKRPAKGPRGNIYTGAMGVTASGALYR